MGFSLARPGLDLLSATRSTWQPALERATRTAPMQGAPLAGLMLYRKGKRNPFTEASHSLLSAPTGSKPWRQAMSFFTNMSKSHPRRIMDYLKSQGMDKYLHFLSQAGGGMPQLDLYRRGAASSYARHAANKGKKVGPGGMALPKDLISGINEEYLNRIRQSGYRGWKAHQMTQKPQLNIGQKITQFLRGRKDMDFGDIVKDVAKKALPGLANPAKPAGPRLWA